MQTRAHTKVVAKTFAVGNELKAPLGACVAKERMVARKHKCFDWEDEWDTKGTNGSCSKNCGKATLITQNLLTCVWLR